MSHRDRGTTLDTETEFVHSQGTTLSHTWRWDAGNVTVNTAGWTALFQIRAGYADSFPALYSVAAGTGRIVLGIQTDGETTWNVQLDLPPADLDIAVLPGGFVGFYELKLTDLSGHTMSFAKQRFCVSGEYASG